MYTTIQGFAGVDRTELPLRVGVDGVLRAGAGPLVVSAAQQAENKISAAAVDCTDARAMLKIHDLHYHAGVTLAINVVRTGAVGDGVLAVRGCADVGQTTRTLDLALLDLTSTSSAKLSSMAISAGSGTQQYLVQVPAVGLTAAELYVQTPDTGGAGSVVAYVDAVAVGMSAGGTLPAVDQAMALRRPVGSIATRIITNRTAVINNQTPNTFRLYCRTAAPYSRVRPVFINTREDQDYTVAACTAHALAQVETDLSGHPSATVTIPGAGLVASSASTFDNDTYVMGDWVDLDSLPMADGSSGGLVCFSAYVSTAAMLSGCGITSGGLEGWATRPTQQYEMREQAGEHVGDPSGFTSTSLESQTIFAGVQYETKGGAGVVTIATVGDSISYGSFADLVTDNAVVRAIDQLAANPNHLPIEQMNLGGPGKTDALYFAAPTPVFDGVMVPDVAIFPNGTPNSVPATLDTADITDWESEFHGFLDRCNRAGITPIAWTVLPEEYGATDHLRRSYNQGLLDNYLAVCTADFSGAIKADELDGSGGETIALEYQYNASHPNDAGYDVLGALLAEKMSPLFIT